MYFEARIRRDGPGYRISFPGLDNVLTYAETKEDALRFGEEALVGCLLEDLDRGLDLPVPLQRKGNRGICLVRIPATLAVALMLRKQRRDKGWTTLQVAKKLRVSRQAYEKLERGKGNPSLLTLRKVFAVFGQIFDLVLKPA